MTATMTGASLAKPDDIWSDLNWPALEGSVLQLQMRIAKAEREGRRGKVRALQRLLTCSFAAKCLAVKRVTRYRLGRQAIYSFSMHEFQKSERRYSA